jgi:hypothetical protein
MKLKEQLPPQQQSSRIVRMGRDRIAATKKRPSGSLTEEMDGIHFVNSSYWERGEMVTTEARAAYKRRLDRLEEIRKELAQLRAA